MTKKYTRKDIGCFADSYFGHEHVRCVLRNLCLDVAATHEGLVSSELTRLAIELAGDMSDDASEENDAIDMLNQFACEDNVWFELRDGDLVLTDESDEG